MSSPPNASLSGPWSARHILIATFIAAFIGIQVGIPTALLFGQRGQRFGWQMFATSGPDVLIVGQPHAGAFDTLDVSAYFAFRRGDLDSGYLSRLPEHICRVRPSFDWVAVLGRDGSTVAKAECR